MSTHKVRRISAHNISSKRKGSKFQGFRSGDPHNRYSSSSESEAEDVESKPTVPSARGWVKEIRELQAQCADRDKLHEEVKQLRIKVEQDAGLEHNLKLALDELKEEKTKMKALDDRIEVLVEGSKDLQQQLQKALSSCSETAEKLKKTRKELEWERIFRTGQKKAKEKLQKELHQMKHEMENLREYNRMLSQKLSAEEQEVKRERAQRLIDVHKLQLAIDNSNEKTDEVEELRSLIQQSMGKEALYRSEVFPLQNALVASSHLSENQMEMIENLEGKAKELQAQVRAHEDAEKAQRSEIRSLKKELAVLKESYGRLQKYVGNSATLSSEKQALVSLSASALSAESPKRRLAPLMFTGLSELTEDPLRPMENSVAVPLRSASPTFSSLNRSIAKSHFQRLAVSRPDSTFLSRKEMTEMLIPRTKPLLGTARPHGPASTQKKVRTVAAASSHRRASTSTRRLLGTPGSMYVGYGLGLKKEPSRVKTGKFSSGSAKQILSRILSEKEAKATAETLSNWARGEDEDNESSSGGEDIHSAVETNSITKIEHHRI